MKRNDAQSIGQLIRAYLRQESLESPLNERRLVNAWPEVVGPAIASYTDGLRCSYTSPRPPCGRN